MFATERQNVVKACDIVRQSPLIGPKIPVHGLLVNIETGKLEWIVNGYESRQLSALPANNAFSPSTDASTMELGAGPMADFHFGEMKFPEMKIGDASVKIGASEAMPLSPPPIAPRMQPLPSAPVLPPKIPLPPPIRARINVPFGRR
jgi:carbonic anhydrase